MNTRFPFNRRTDHSSPLFECKVVCTLRGVHGQDDQYGFHSVCARSYLVPEEAINTLANLSKKSESNFKPLKAII